MGMNNGGLAVKKRLAYLLSLGMAAVLTGACGSSSDDLADSEPGGGVPTPEATEVLATGPVPTVASFGGEPVSTDSFLVVPPLASGQAALQLVRMSTSQVGWAIGSSQRPLNRVLRTEDGGLTWRDASPPEGLLVGGDTAIEAEGFFLDADHAWVTYYDAGGAPSSANVWSTVDGGATWQASGELAFETSGEFYRPRLNFADANAGWFAATHGFAGMGGSYFNMVFRTVDGGRTWQGQSLDSGDITGLAAAPGDPLRAMITQSVPGAAYGWPIEFFITHDGGRIWRTQELPAPADQPGLFSAYDRCYASSPVFLPSGPALAVVTCENDSGDSAAFITRTADDWTTASAFPFNGRDLLFVGETGWGLGRQVSQTTDGGRSWTPIKTVNWDGQFSFVDSLEGWAVASSQEGSALVHTTDGGRSWEILEAVIAGVEAGAPGAGGASIWPGDSDCQIGFLTARDDLRNPQSDLFVVGCDGADPVRVTDGTRWVLGFDWSPDGERIALILGPETGLVSTLAVMNADGSGLVEIAPADYADGAPSWSPDGRWIAFVGEPDPDDFGDRPVMVVAPDGSGSRALTHDLSTVSPSWSPDGSRIAFSTWSGEIWVTNTDGSGATRLAAGPANLVHWIAWSPDGRLLLFVGGDSHGEAYPPLDLYTLAADGRGGPRLVTGGTSDFGATWCPDSSCILFTQGDSEDSARLFVVGVDGGNLQPFPGDNRGFSPQWRP